MKLKAYITSVLLVTLVVSTSVVHAQDGGGLGDVELRVFTSPMMVVPVIANPQVTLGVEMFVDETWSVSVEGGYKYMDTSNRQLDTAFVDSQGYSLRVEYKAYKNGIWDGRIGNDYLSLEYKYLSDQYNESYCYYDPQEISLGRSYEDHFSVAKKIHVLTAKYGVTVALGNKLYVEPFAGVGIRYRMVENTDRENVQDHGFLLCSGTPFVANREWDSNTGISPSFSLGIKFGIRF